MPKLPGVYIFRDKAGKIIYIGKAASLYDRVYSYWRKGHDFAKEQMIREIFQISYKKTPSVIEALILEANLVKKYQPKYNSRLKDDKSFLYVGITKEDFPRIILLRKTDLIQQNNKICDNQRINSCLDGRQARRSAIREAFGPFVSAASLKSGLAIIRRIFPYRNCDVLPKKICLYGQIRQCSAPCAGLVNKKEYRKNISNAILFFKGKKNQIVKNMEKEMKKLVKREKFEEAGLTKKRLFALNHIRDTALIVNDEEIKLLRKIPNSNSKIEGYDISNLGEKEAVGSMVVFKNKKPQKSGYRKFKIKTIKGVNDVAAMKEILRRRLKRKEWPFPDLILIDGGRAHVGAAEKILAENNLKIPAIGIAKGFKRKQNRFVVGGYGYLRSPETVLGLKKFVKENNLLLKQVRDEAHRFAIKYLRSKMILKLK